MGREEQIICERLKKIDELNKKGINPYPNSYEKKNNASELQEKYKKLKKGSKKKDKVKIAGRLLVIRDIGKLIFANLIDGTGKIQIMLKKGETPEKTIKFFKDYLDAGDFAGIEGTIARTERGELSVIVKNLVLLSKSVLPLPEKWHGLKDDEERYRKRYLDLIMNPELKELFNKKYIFWKTMREFLAEKGFIEVETPVLENTTGGADAKPFVTHYNALDKDVYLRISTGELWQKRLMIAGFEKTFEIGRQFRNEGISMEHLQDYTQMEFYWAYANYNDAMKLVEEMYKKLAKAVLGKLKFKTHGFEVDLGKKWQKIDYTNEIKKQTGINIINADKDKIIKKLKELKQDYDPHVDKWRLIDVLWKYCRKNIKGPVFIINIPVEISPLAKRSDKNLNVVERFWVVFAGSEIGNGYSELNDSVDQEMRFEKQEEMRKKGDEEAQMMDKEFVEALKYGMPPTAGFGISERLFAYLVDKPIRECVIFPILKPVEEKK